MTTIDAEVSRARPGTSNAGFWAGLGVAIVGLIWAYSSSLGTLIGRWSRDDDYSHGFFVLPIVGVILWQRRAKLESRTLAPSWWGVGALVTLLAGRAWMFERNDQWLEWATIPIAASLVTLALGGRWAVAWAWPALAFSCFMVPLPSSANTALSGPLQSLATLASVTLLRATGLAVISEGNVIIVGGERLEVARACNGLSMLLSFTTLVAAMIVLVARPLRERVALALSIVPVALLCNVLRIVATAWSAHLAGHMVEAAHDWAGYAMMPLALVFLWLELRVMSWIFVEIDPAATRPSPQPLAGVTTPAINGAP